MNKIGKEVNLYSNQEDLIDYVLNRVPIQYHDKMKRQGGFYDKTSMYNAGEVVKLLVLDNPVVFPVDNLEGNARLLHFMSLVNENETAPLIGVIEDHIPISNIPYYYGTDIVTSPEWILLNPTSMSKVGKRLRNKFIIENQPIKNTDEDVTLIELLNGAGLGNCGVFRVAIKRLTPNGDESKTIRLNFDIEFRVFDSIPMIKVKNVYDFTTYNVNSNPEYSFGTASRRFRDCPYGLVLSLVNGSICLGVISDNSSISQEVEVTIQDLGYQIIHSIPDLTRGSISSSIIKIQ